MKLRALTLLLGLSLIAAGCGGDDNSKTSSTAASPADTTTTETTPTTASEGDKPEVKVPEGSPPKKLVIKDIKKGDGKAARSGDTVTVQYVGVDYKTGKQFDASWDRGQPLSFPLGAGQVIPGWDRGLVGMKVGGQRQLIIPPRLAYGAQGQPPTIQPNATLVFVVDLVDVQ